MMTKNRGLSWPIIAFLLMAPLVLTINFASYFDSNGYYKGPCSSDANADNSVSGPETRSNTSKTPGKEELDFIKLSYEYSVKEIQYRIQQEHLLFIFKFSIVGAVLGVLFRSNRQGYLSGKDNLLNSPIAAVCCWSAVAIASIIDVRTLVNLDLITQAGCWNKTIEQYFITDIPYVLHDDLLNL